MRIAARAVNSSSGEKDQTGSVGVKIRRTARIRPTEINSWKRRSIDLPASCLDGNGRNLAMTQNKTGLYHALISNNSPEQPQPYFRCAKSLRRFGSYFPLTAQKTRDCALMGSSLDNQL